MGEMNILENIITNHDKLAIFCGAGISYNSGLPLASQLVEYILNKLPIKIKDNEEILETIINGKKVLKIPFESFIEILSKNSDVEPIIELFKEGESNAAHHFIAKLAKYDFVKTIITTNFDLLLENALEAENINYEKYFDEKQFAKVKFDNIENNVVLIKIHGCAKYLNSVRTTLQMIARKQLFEERMKIMKYLLSNGTHNKVLFLGYSFSDIFDINVMIKKIGKEKNKKDILIIEHEKSGYIEKDLNKIDENSSFESDNIALLFQDYKGKRIKCNTDQFIKNQWLKRITIFGEYNQFKSEKINWERFISSWFYQVESKGYNNYIVGSIFDYIGNSQKAINYFNNALEELEGTDKNGLLNCCTSLGASYLNLHSYIEAIDLYKLSLKLANEISNKKAEIISYLGLGSTNLAIGEKHISKFYFEKALEISLKIAEKTNKYDDNVIDSYLSLGNYYFAINNVKEAIKYYKPGLDITREKGDKRKEIELLTNLGSSYKFMGDNKDAIEFFEYSIRVAHDLGDNLLELRCLIKTAELYQFLGMFEKAIQSFKMGIDISKYIGNEIEKAAVHEGLANVYNDVGEIENAITEHEIALKISKRLNYKIGEAACNFNLGYIYVKQGDFLKAMECCQNSLIIAKNTNNQKRILDCYGLLSQIYYALKDFNKSLEHGKLALGIAKAIYFKEGIAACFINIANSYHGLGEFKTSIIYNEKALKLFEKLNSKSGIATVFTNLGNNYRKLGLYPEALQHHQSALKISIEINDRESEGTCYENIGDVYKSMNDFLRARENYLFAIVVFKELNLNNYLSVIFKKLESVL